MTIVQFAARAADYPGCADLKLLNNPEAVAQFADCLRSVAGAYRKGLDPALTKKIGVDTNYVAAMEQAAKHLPPDAERPAMILFTDGKHDVTGVPVERGAARPRSPVREPLAVRAAAGRDGSRPEGARPRSTAGLEAMRIIRDMPACVSGATFDWPQVVFETPDEAGDAVARRAPGRHVHVHGRADAGPDPAADPGRGPGGPASPPRDGRIELTWAAPADDPGPDRRLQGPLPDRRRRLDRIDGGRLDRAEHDHRGPDERAAVPLRGRRGRCHVAGPVVAGRQPRSPRSGDPAVPASPRSRRSTRRVQISVPPADPAAVSGFRYECSSDNGATWPVTLAVTTVASPAAEIGGLTNGVEYVCRAFADNAIGASDASPVSGAVKPCGWSPRLQQPPRAAPRRPRDRAGRSGSSWCAYALYRDRSRRGYVVAVVDVIHTANLGHGSKLGIAFVRAPGTE